MDKEFGASDIIDYRGLGLGNYNNYNRGDSFLSAQAHADGTAVKEAIDCNSTRVSDGMSRISDQAEEGRRQAQVTALTDGMVNAEFRSSDRITGVNANISNAEFRSLDRQRDIEKALATMALANCKCCEEAKLLATQNACATDKLIIEKAAATDKLIIEKAAATDALVLAVEGRANLDKLAEARAQIAALQNQSHHHRP